MALLGNFIGGALGMQSAEDYEGAVTSASRLQALQRKNQFTKDMMNSAKPADPAAVRQVAPFNPGDAFAFDNLQQPGLRNIPVPPVDQEGGVAQGIDEADKVTDQEVKPPLEDPYIEPVAPTVPEFDSGKTVINPNDNQNLPNNQIPKPEFQDPDLSNLFPDGVVSENDISDADKTDLHVQGFPWKVLDKNGGKVVVHNGVEYDIKKIGDSYVLTNRMGMPNYPLTDAFTKGRSRGITNTEITPRTNSAMDDLAAATVDNKYIANALKSIKNNKFQNGITNSTTAYARQFGIDQGEALALLAIESNFGNVKFDSRSSTRGPLQIQNLAFKDVKAYFKGANPANSGVSDEQWAAMTSAAANLPKNHANLTDTNDQIAAGLLYFKMIGLKGVDKKFQAAAYFDGYGKYIGINDISDVKKFSGPNTLATVTQYNSAFLGMRGYMGQVADYYYPQGGALAGASTTTQGNTVGQPNMPTDDQIVADASKALDSADTTQTDTAPVGASTMTQGNTVGMPSAQTQTVTNADGTEKESIATTEVTEPEQEIVKFLQNPPNIGIEMQNLLNGRKLGVDNLNRQLQSLNEQINANNAKAAEYDRFADIALANGQIATFERYSGLADGLIKQSNDLRNSGLDAQNQARVAMQEFDNKMLLVQGAQALQDLSFGSTARAGAVLSAFSGLDIQIVPRSDGKFDLMVNGNRQQTYTMAELSDKLQRTYSQAYRESQTKLQTERQTYLFEKGVDLEAELTKQRDKLLGDLKLKNLDNAGAAYLEELKQRKGEFKALGEGFALIYDNGQYFLLQPQAVEETINGEKVRRPKLTPLSPGQAQALNAGGATADDFKAAAK
jgi:hypothetical protein